MGNDHVKIGRLVRCNPLTSMLVYLYLYYIYVKRREAHLIFMYYGGRKGKDGNLGKSKIFKVIGQGDRKEEKVKSLQSDFSMSLLDKKIDQATVTATGFICPPKNALAPLADCLLP